MNEEWDEICNHCLEEFEEGEELVELANVDNCTRLIMHRECYLEWSQLEEDLKISRIKESTNE